MHLLFSLFGIERLRDIEFAQGFEVVDEVLGDLDGLLGVQQGFFVPIELGEQGADLHVNFALVLQLLQLLGRLLAEHGRQVDRIYLLQASIEAQSALLECSNLLKAEGHIVHGNLDQESIFRVLLKLESVEEGLGLLKQRKGAVALVLRDEVDR